MKKAFLVIAIGLAILGVVAWSTHGLIPGVFIYGIPTASDAEEASGIVRHVSDHYSFSAQWQVYTNRPPIYCNPGSGGGLFGPHPHRFIVYTVIDTPPQDQILNLIREYRSKMGLRPIIVTFCREENWQAKKTSDGGESGLRGKEDILRTGNLN